MSIKKNWHASKKKLEIFCQMQKSSSILWQVNQSYDGLKLGVFLRKWGKSSFGKSNQMCSLVLRIEQRGKACPLLILKHIASN